MSAGHKQRPHVFGFCFLNIPLIIFRKKEKWECFRDTYMVLLNVLDQGWVIKLCGVVAVGRQITMRQEKEIYDRSHISFWHSNTFAGQNM